MAKYKVRQDGQGRLIVDGIILSKDLELLIKKLKEIGFDDYNKLPTNKWKTITID